MWLIYRNTYIEETEKYLWYKTTWDIWYKVCLFEISEILRIYDFVKSANKNSKLASLRQSDFCLQHKILYTKYFDEIPQANRNQIVSVVLLSGIDWFLLLYVICKYKQHIFWLQYTSHNYTVICDMTQGAKLVWCSCRRQPVNQLRGGGEVYCIMCERNYIHE